MKFFIDTANLEQIQEAYDLGVLDGVTTNPSLMAKEGIKGTQNQREHYIKICEIVNGDVSAEVIATDYEGMIREGEELAALNPHIVVKVPCIADGIKAIKHFTEKGIRTNCTLVFSVGQALLAAKAGATYVSPFVGRLDDICEDGVRLVGDIVRMYRTYDYKTQVLAASIRNTKHIIECVEVGARHIAQALEIPSFAIYSPSASKSMWLPANSVLARGISPDDILPPEQQATLTYEERFASITPEKVYDQLTSTLRQLS